MFNPERDGTHVVLFFSWLHTTCPSVSAGMTLYLRNTPSLSQSGSAVHPSCPFNAGIRHVGRQYGFVLCYKVSLFTSLTGLLKAPGLVKSRHYELFYPKHLVSLQSAPWSLRTARGLVWFSLVSKQRLWGRQVWVHTPPLLTSLYWPHRSHIHNIYHHSLPLLYLDLSSASSRPL